MTRPCVLVVDDDPDHLEISSTLLRHHGYDVLEALTGEQGLVLALEHSPDLVLLDVRLPAIDGWTLTRRLREEPRTSRSRILIFTAFAFQSDREHAYSAGADGYLPKPSDPMRVLTAIRSLIGPPVHPPLA